jgi:hypothetical protein
MLTWLLVGLAYGGGGGVGRPPEIVRNMPTELSAASRSPSIWPRVLHTVTGMCEPMGRRLRHTSSALASVAASASIEACMSESGVLSPVAQAATPIEVESASKSTWIRLAGIVRYSKSVASVSLSGLHWHYQDRLHRVACFVGRSASKFTGQEIVTNVE